MFNEIIISIDDRTFLTLKVVHLMSSLMSFATLLRKGEVEANRLLWKYCWVSEPHEHKEVERSNTVGFLTSTGRTSVLLPVEFAICCREILLTATSHCKLQVAMLGLHWLQACYVVLAHQPLPFCVPSSTYIVTMSISASALGSYSSSNLTIMNVVRIDSLFIYLSSSF